jgi:ABC-2 type transport system permease protein
MRAFKKYLYLLENLVKKDFTTKYRRSFLGVLWSVLNPLLMAAVISAVFSNIMKIQMENFAIFYLSGSLLFNFVSEATSGSVGSILGAAGLIKKVYIPKYIFPMEKCFFALINAMFSFAALLIIMLILGVRMHATMLLFWVPLLYALVFSVGFGMILAAANVFFRDIGHLYSVWMMAWMYLTPVIYPMEILPDVMKLSIQRFNPLYHYVSYFREVVMYGAVPDLSKNAVCIVWAAGVLLLGAFVFKRSQDRFILYI